MLAVLLMTSALVISAVVEMKLDAAYPWNGLMVLMLWWVTPVLSAPPVMCLYQQQLLNQST